MDWALRNQRPSSELIQMLRPLVRATAPASPSGLLARLQLAERLVEVGQQRSHAWEAVILGRAVVQGSADPDLQRRGFGVQGLGLTMLGHYRLARSAYLSALSLEPCDPVCAHNLGHLEVTKFQAYDSGVRWLRIAYAHLPDCREIAASLAHALLLCGQRPRAEALLNRILGSHSEAHSLMARWLSEAR